jgi:hypothetical protein
VVRADAERDVHGVGQPRAAVQQDRMAADQHEGNLPGLEPASHVGEEPRQRIRRAEGH